MHWRRIYFVLDSTKVHAVVYRCSGIGPFFLHWRVCVCVSYFRDDRFSVPCCCYSYAQSWSNPFHARFVHCKCMLPVCRPFRVCCILYVLPYLCNLGFARVRPTHPSFVGLRSFVPIVRVQPLFSRLPLLLYAGVSCACLPSHGCVTSFAWLCDCDGRFFFLCVRS